MPIFLAQKLRLRLANLVTSKLSSGEAAFGSYSPKKEDPPPIPTMQIIFGIWGNFERRSETARKRAAGKRLDGVEMAS